MAVTGEQRPRSRRNRLYARALLFTLVGSGSLVGAVAVQSSYMIRGSVEQLFKDRLELSRTTGRLIEHLIREDAGNLASAAAGPLSEGAGPAQLRRALRPIVPNTIFAEGAFALDAAGRFLTALPEDAALEPLALRANLAEKARAAGGPVSATLLDAATSRQVLVIVTPALDGAGSVAGFAGGVVHPASANLFGSIGEPEASATLQLIDESGSVVASSRAGADVGVHDHDSVLAEAIRNRRDVRGRCHTCHSAPSGGAPLWRRSSVDVLAFVPLPTLRFGIAVRQPEDEAFGPAFALQRRLILLGGSFVALYLIFTGLAVQSVVSPVARLTGAVQKIEELGTGPESLAHMLPSFGDDEMGALSQAIDRWRERVAQSVAEIERHEQALGREAESTRRHLAALQKIAEFGSRRLDLDAMVAHGLRQLLEFLEAPAGALAVWQGEERVSAQEGLAQAAQHLDQAHALLGGAPGTCRIETGGELVLAALAASPQLAVGCAVARGASLDARKIESFLHLMVMSAANRLLVEQEALRNQQSRDFLHRLLTAQEEERRRIARELHDTVAQDLAAHRLQIERLHSDDPALAAKLRLVEAEARHVLDMLRALLVDLRPSLLDTMGFLPALQWHLERMGRDHPIRGSLATDGHERPLSREMGVILFRIFQEALQNVVLHAKAEHVVVTVRFGERGLEMVIEDDGSGFDPRTVGRVRPDGHGLGLVGMMERASLLHGTVAIDSQADSGTVVTVQVPWSEEERAAA